MLLTILNKAIDRGLYWIANSSLRILRRRNSEQLEYMQIFVESKPLYVRGLLTTQFSSK